MKKTGIVAALGLALLALPLGRLEGANPVQQSAAELARQQFDLRIHTFEDRLRSGDAEREQKVIADLKAWVVDEVRPQEGPEVLLRLQGSLMNARHYGDFLGLLNLAVPNVPVSRPDQRRDLVVLQCRCQFKLREFDAGVTTFKKLMAADGPGAVRQLGDEALGALLAGQRYTDVEELGLQIILARPEDTGRVETVLQDEIKAFNLAKRYDKALAAAKQLLAISTMAHTGDALLVVSRQFGLAHPEDKTVVERFRKEQVEGAAAGSEGRWGDAAEIGAGGRDQGGRRALRGGVEGCSGRRF